MTTITATYSPDDNKIRLSASQRLDRETYDRVKAAGFRWAPKQEQFIAPMWTPDREDLALKLSGQEELDDENSTLADRAEQRAERFEEYSGKRLADANRAADAVAAIADNIPLGQPILIGHHSEKHARRDAAKIENGMRKAVKMWETSEYWTRRAAGALRHAEYKERPEVRARRIKTIEAELRKMQRGDEANTKNLTAWESVDSLERAVHVANVCSISATFPLVDYPRDLPASQYEGMMLLWSALTGGVCTWEQAKVRALKALNRHRPHWLRWSTHYTNRLVYERAMMAESGGIASDQTRPEKGGAVKCWVGGDRWCEIQKVNPTSVSVLDNYGNGGRDFLRTVPFDKLREVITRAAWLTMQGKPADTPLKQAPKPGPICNYRVEGCVELTEAEFNKRRKYGAALYQQRGETLEHGRHKVRVNFAGGYTRQNVFITDLPVKEAPAGVAFATGEEVAA
jgi:hypothetical protein